MSLALSTLLYEWRRYLAAVIALAVAGLLVLSMAGMFMGMGKTFTATIDRSPAEVMVLPPQAVTLFANNGVQPRRIIPAMGRVIRIAATFGACKLKSDTANEASDERVVEVVVSVENASFLIGQRVLVKFLKR